MRFSETLRALLLVVAGAAILYAVYAHVRFRSSRNPSARQVSQQSGDLNARAKRYERARAVAVGVVALAGIAIVATRSCVGT